MVHCYMLTLSLQPKIWGFHVVVLWSTAKKRTEIRAPRAARVFFPFSTNNILDEMVYEMNHI